MLKAAMEKILADGKKWVKINRDRKKRKKEGK